MADVIHPDSWQARQSSEIQRFNRGELPISRYIRPLCAKLLGRRGVERIRKTLGVIHGDR